MGQILLVRHGQASWGARDYDVLSPLGEEQPGVLGRALRSLEPDVVVHGTMKRQRRTAELAIDAAGWAPVEPLVDQAWNEMDHLAILAAAPRDFEGEPDPGQFQKWFEAATDRWTSGESDPDYDEPYPAFRGRVLAALDRLASAGTAVVFTSGGPISVAASALLDSGMATYRKLAPVVVNTSVTRIVSGRRGLTLLSFNDHSHLSPEQLTYR
jgi:broad specificity phosphatase PhoE